ncbi:MAG: efflux RND transporter periplasmic adaptor subunit [Ancrocorticia sp.]|uniref:efflux RND transporter periplasmic adaptor subunit n=1 Tax=Ancrocorticia sp. TaxID=2593684 RepID=UPI003F8DE59A
MIVLSAVAAVVAVACVGGATIFVSTSDPTSEESDMPVTTATVESGDLSKVVSASGTLTYRARSDGTPYVAINQASGTYTALPATGDAVACGDTLYRVDNNPVLLLCGETPLYRDLTVGTAGADVAQLNRNLHTLGYDTAAGVEIDSSDDEFSWSTSSALANLQQDRGQDQTGALARADAVVLPSAIRVASVPAELGVGAQAGTPVVEATSEALVVQVRLDAAQRTDVLKDSPALITLPGNTSTTGQVTEMSTVVTTPDGQNGAQDVKFLVTITLDNPDEAAGFDQAPVRTQITSAGVEDVLSVPVVALVGSTGGGYAVDVVGEDGRRKLVPVTLGLFDQTSGRVQVEGDLNPGDEVVVPS